VFYDRVGVEITALRSLFCMTEKVSASVLIVSSLLGDAEDYCLIS